MPRRAAGLTAAKVRTAKPGRYGDGSGLYLLVRSAEARFWVFRYTLDGRMREMGLGSAMTFSLAETRVKAVELHRKVKLGIDPLAERDAAAASARTVMMSISVEKFPGNSVQKFPVYQPDFDCFLRCLKRKESFPVSSMSQ